MSLLSDYIEYASASQSQSLIGDVVYVLTSPSTSSELRGYVRNNGAYSQTTYSALYEKMGLIRIYNDAITWTARTSGTASNLFDVAYGNGLYVAVGVGGALVTSTNAITWTLPTSPTSTQLEAVTYGNGLFYIVGQNGANFSSTNGVTWTARSGLAAATASDALATVYGNGLYVLTLTNGQLRTSTNLDTWTTITRSSSSVIYAFTYGNGKFFGAGLNGILATSTNGTTWVEQGLGGTFDVNNSVGQVSYSNGLFVAISNGGEVFTCLDSTMTSGGVSGSILTDLNVAVQGVNYSDGLYVMGTSLGAFYFSTNGTDWATRTSFTSSAISRIISSSANNTYIAVTTGGGIFTSAYNDPYYNFSTHFYVPSLTSTQDALNDSPGNYSNPGTSYAAYVKATNTDLPPLGSFSKSLFYNANSASSAPSTLDRGNSIRAGKAYLKTSYPDLFNQIGTYGAAVMTPRDEAGSPTVTNTRIVAFGNGLYLYGGNDGKLRTSTNGITWSTATPVTPRDIYSITYGNGIYVLGTVGGDIDTSTDGVTWTSRISGTSSNIFSLAYGHGIYVATSENAKLRTSTNGITWNTGDSNSSYDIRSVVYGNGIFVLASTTGASAVPATSTNGITWVSTGLFDITGETFTLAYGNGLYLSGGAAGYLHTSTNGVTWTARTSGTATTINLLAYGAGVYILGDALGVLRTSTDAITWTTRTTGFAASTSSFAGATYGNGLFVLGSVAITGRAAQIHTTTDAVSLQYSSFYDAATEFYVPLVKNYTIETLTTNAVTLQEIPYVRAI
jgi:hypothetical protein